MNLYKRILKKIAHIQVRHPVTTVLIVLAITLIFMGGASQVRTVAALEQMMPGDLNEISAFNTLRDAGIGQDIVAVVIQLNPESTLPRNNILEWDIYQHVKLVTETLKEEQDILEVYSLSTLLEQFNNGEELQEATFNKFIHDEAIKQHLLNYANRAKTNTLIIATTDVSANDARMNLLAQRIIADMESVGSPRGVNYKLTGTPIIQQELGKLIAHDRQVTKNLSTLLVFLIVMLIFGTVTSAIVPIAIVTISVTWLYGTMGYTGLPISTLAGGVAAMVIGIGIDYAIHLMNRFKYERKQGREVKEAIESAVTDTGVATTGAAITTMLAFIAFLSGAMPEMHRFGLLMTIGVGYSFILTITALPAMLVLEERLFFKLKKHLHFGVEGEYFLATKNESCPPGFVTIKEHEHNHLYKKFGENFSVYKKKNKQHNPGNNKQGEKR